MHLLLLNKDHEIKMVFQRFNSINVFYFRFLISRCGKISKVCFTQVLLRVTMNSCQIDMVSPILRMVDICPTSLTFLIELAAAVEKLQHLTILTTWELPALPRHPLIVGKVSNKISELTIFG